MLWGNGDSRGTDNLATFFHICVTKVRADGSHRAWINNRRATRVNPWNEIVITYCAKAVHKPWRELVGNSKVFLWNRLGSEVAGELTS